MHSLTRLSSQSRTVGCSTSCASAPTILARHWNIRPQQAKCSTSLAAHQTSFSQFLIQFFRPRGDCAKQNMPAFLNCRTENTTWQALTTPKQLMLSTSQNTL